MLHDLRASCTNEDGSDDQRKGTQLLEVLALEIEMHTEQRHAKTLKQLYGQALAVKSAIPHPRIMGVIRECGGKVHMAERSWAAAATDFFEAFKSYDEAGAGRRIQCLKYLVLASMLMNSSVNPFDAQEAKPYKARPDVGVWGHLCGVCVCLTRTPTRLPRLHSRVPVIGRPGGCGDDSARGGVPAQRHRRV